jgi:Helix-destabilising protein
VSKTGHVIKFDNNRTLTFLEPTMIKIVVTSPDIREMKGVGKTSGKPYHMRFQTGHAFTVDKDGVVAEFPDKFEIILEADQVPYARGSYTLQPSAVFVSREGRLELRPRLAPVAASTAKA